MHLKTNTPLLRYSNTPGRLARGNRQPYKSSQQSVYFLFSAALESSARMDIFEALG
jgi:hypothetical protein